MVDGEGELPEPSASEIATSDRPTDIDLSLVAAAAAQLAAVEPRAPSPFAPTEIRAQPTTEVAPELIEGTLLAGRYQIAHLIGRGGMGAVYAARDDELDEDIALKVLRPELGRDADFRGRLKSEVRLARRVSHPNVCRVHDFGIDDEVVFVTMELVRGRTLRERLLDLRAGRAEPFELAQIVDVISQIGAALAAAHRANVIHRDVKPDNVILSDGRVVLADFGVASMSFDASRALVGTPAYLAPELLRGEAYDHRVDVYAVACIAFELIAGAPPFAADSLDHAFDRARNPPEYPGLPERFATTAARAALDRVLRMGLASDPAVRPPTIEQLTDAFAYAARTAPRSQALRAPTSEHPITTDTPTPPPPRRSELRVTTTLVWYGERTVAIEEAERIVVDARGIPIRIAPGELVALFGATHSLVTGGATGADAERAAHAALTLVAKLGGRAGIDTTRIVRRPRDTSLAGPESAAVAAALAREAHAGEVRASPPTARQVSARFDIAPTAGAARRVTAARPESRRRADVSIESLRAEELAAIEAHLERAFRDRTPAFVEVRGPAGSGKTRMRTALIASVIARRDVHWLVAIMPPVGDPAPLSVVASASAEWYEATTKSSDPAERELLARRWLDAQATRRPLVLLVEDAHGIDPTSRALLDRLRTTLEHVPVAIVTFVRAGTPAAPDGVATITLQPLDDARAGHLARAIAPAAPPAVIAELVKRAAGNPFFVEELAYELAAGELRLPATIEAVVQASLDQLPETARQLAIVAAVIGRGFWRRAAARLLPGLDDTAVDTALADLERAAIVTAVAPLMIDDDYYQFSSTLVREVAYTRTPARERRRLHAAVAAWLDEESDSAEQGTSHLLAVAHHREHGGDVAGAAAAYRQAGTRCLEIFAYGEAVAALRKAAAIVTVPDPRLQEALADAVAETEGHGAAEPLYEHALDETDDDDHASRARLLYKLGLAASKRGNIASALARFHAGLAIAAPNDTIAPWATSDPRTPALLWASLGWTLGYLQGDDAGHALCERAVALLEPTPYRRDLAFALSRLGGTCMRACRFVDQLRCNQRNLEIAIELHDLNMQLTANINLGVTHGVLGDIEAAIRATLAARKLASRMGATASDGLAASNLAGFYLELGRLDEADELLDHAIAVLERTGNRYALPESLVFRARIAAARGDLVAARSFADSSLALARSVDSQLDIAIAMRILAQLAGLAGDYTAALRSIDEALELLSFDRLEATKTRAARARIHAISGTADTAELASIRGELARLGTRREVATLQDLTQVR